VAYGPGDAVDALVERQNRAHPGCLRLRNEISLCKIKPVYLIDLKCAKQRLGIDRPDRRERDYRPHEFRHPRPRDLVERLEHVDALGNDEVYEQQLRIRFERRRRPRRQLGRIAGQVADENVGVQNAVSVAFLRGKPEFA
jgi:hypothetical protein